MKTLNRTLSLALVFALVFSLMSFAFADTTTTASTTSAATTTFSDQASIKNTDAVKTMVALNVINGYPDGSYKPTETVTRAQMCKMICTALNGGTAPVLGTSATAAYTDTKGTWAEAYIEYCTKLGIVSGNGDGTFAPDAGVTGSQAAKMLLVALGYDAKTEGFTGASWELNVNVRANQNSLYTKLSTLNPTTALNRDNAAQMIYNSLSADVVALKADGTYDKKTVTTSVGDTVKTGTETWYKLQGTASPLKDVSALNGTEYKTYADAAAAATAKTTGAALGTDYTLTAVSHDVYGAVTVSSTTTETLGHKYLSLATFVGVLGTVGYVQNKGYTATIGATTFTEIANDPSSFIGQKVKLLYEDGDTSSVYGIYAHKDTTIADKMPLAAIGGSLNGDNEIKNVLTSTTYKTKFPLTDMTLPVYSTTGASLGTVGTVMSSPSPVYKASLGSMVTLIDNDADGKLDCAVLDYVEVYKVGYVSTTDVTLIAPEGAAVLVGNATSYKLNDQILAYDGMAKGDYVVYRPATGSAKNLPTLTKVTAVTAKVEGTKTQSGVNAVKVGTNWLPIAPVAPTAGTFPTAFTTGNTLSFVQVNGTIYSYIVSNAVASGNFLVLEGFANKYDSVYAQAFLADGTSKEIQIGKVSDSGVLAEYYPAQYDGTAGSNAYYAEKGGAKTDKYDSGTDFALTTNTLYGYSVGSDGKYNLSDVSTVYGAGNLEGTYGYKYFGNQNFGSNKFADLTSVDPAAKVIVYNATDKTYTAVTGATVLAWSTTATASSCEYVSTLVNGYKYANVAFMTVTASYGSTSTYGYVVDAYSTTSDGKAGTQYTIWNGTKNVEAFCANADTMSAATHDVVRYDTVDEKTIKIKGKYDLTDNAVQVAAKNDTAKVYTFDNMNTATVTPGLAPDVAFEATTKTQIIYIDSKDTTTAAGKTSDGTIPQANTDASGNLLGVPNAMYVVTGENNNGDSKVRDLDVIVVDVANKIDGVTTATVGTVAAATDTTANVKVTVTPNVTSAAVGQRITYKVTVVGTADADGKVSATAAGSTVVLTFPGLTGAATTTTANSNTTVSGLTISITADSAVTNATYYFTGTLKDTTVPTITITAA